MSGNIFPALADFSASSEESGYFLRELDGKTKLYLNVKLQTAAS